MGNLKTIDIGLDTPRWALEEDVKKYQVKEWVSEKPTDSKNPKVTDLEQILTEGEKNKNVHNLAKEMRDMLKIAPVKPITRKKFTKEEKAERLERFKKEHGIKS